MWKTGRVWQEMERVQAATEEGWNQAWSDFKDKYSGIPEAVAYIYKQWIPFKTRFFSAWTNLVLHFNNVNTLRVEGAHSVIKTYLKVSTMDLWDVCRRLEMAMRNAVGELRAAIGSNNFKVWSDHEDGFYYGVVKLFSAYALHEVHHQMELLDDLTVASQCAGVFTTTMGLPCVHTIAARKRSGGILHLGDFHKQWHLKAVRLSEVSNDTITRRKVLPHPMSLMI
ncbi:hypothetical protein PsorP6_007475 [Peronosclerospora sorghi]|uniref:Uncharacterized protein n=1 Tax=Peronosclerospora sorghi TaxID=230839 RepID=A0ACC0W7M0_9STRA|nr:hypothetical protein PsorP6_007475 [Peronosclerospora sorghi]